MSTQRLNEFGFEVDNCKQCDQEININSLINGVCIMCIDDNIVKVWIFTDGDYNDIYNRHVIKGTAIQVKDYTMKHFDEYDKDEIEDLGSDSIGFAIIEPIDGMTEYYAESTEIENYDPNQDGEISIDLTEDNNQVSTE